MKGALRKRPVSVPGRLQLRKEQRVPTQTGGRRAIYKRYGKHGKRAPYSGVIARGAAGGCDPRKTRKARKPCANVEEPREWTKVVPRKAWRSRKGPARMRGGTRRHFLRGVVCFGEALPDFLFGYSSPLDGSSLAFLRFVTAWRSRNSIWPLTLRRSSAAHFSSSFQRSGGIRSRNGFRSGAGIRLLIIVSLFPSSRAARPQVGWMHGVHQL
jgi:hypothetical protein